MSWGHNRTMPEIRVKWRDYSTATKKRAAALRKESSDVEQGCDASHMPHLTPEEETVLRTLEFKAGEDISGDRDVSDHGGAAPSHPLVQNAKAPTSAVSISYKYF